MRSAVPYAGAGLALGVPVALLGPGDFVRGWLAAALLITLAACVLAAAWRWAGHGRELALWLVLAFLLRLVAGVGVSLALPAWGYDEEVQRAGYLFPDAYKRDTEAYNLAVSDQRMLFNPELSLTSDQYGGLGLTSAAVYRYLSPDAHRPFLILILGSLFFALGVPFLWQAARLRLPERAARLAIWFFILYPDGLFFTISQMREPFMLGLSAMALWAVLAWRQNRRGALAALGFSAAAMLFFATRSAVFVLGVLAILFWLDFTAARGGKQWKWLGWAGLALAALAAVLVTWDWFRSASVWDMVLAQRNSGWVTRVIGMIGDRFAPFFILLYGLAQPVLPATIADTALPLWKGIVILRSLGWYIIAPLLLYTAAVAWKETDGPRRRLALWAVISVGIWACVASFRAGGDLTDNPRYRMLFLPLITLAAAWAVEWARTHHDFWLVRWLLVEAIFLGFFTQWYFSRYFKLGGRMGFMSYVAWVAGLSVLVLLGGLVWDRFRRPRPNSKDK
jgi:hypothetical protein